MSSSYYIPAKMSPLQLHSPPPSPTMSDWSSSSDPITCVTPRLRTIPLPPVTPSLPSPYLTPPPSPLPPLLLHPLLAPRSAVACDFNYPPSVPSSYGAELSMPATHPPTSYLRIVTKDHPWTIEVTEPRGGTLTVGQVLNAIYHALQVPIAEWELRLASKNRREMIGKAYHQRRGTDELKRIDWLGGKSLFDGLRKDDGESVKVLMVSDTRMPLTLVISLRYPS